MNGTGLNGKESGNSGGGAPMPDWDQCLRTYRQNGIWDQVVLGPPPGHAGCRVPPLLVQYYGYDLDLDIYIDAPRSPPGENDCREHVSHQPKYTNQDDRETNAATDWPDPCPLPESLLAVDPFTLDLMPEKLRPWVADVTERMQCPPDFVAVSQMAGLGSLIGRKVVIRPQAQNDWQSAATCGRFLLVGPVCSKARPWKKLCSR
jgi:hypothetical protein